MMRKTENDTPKIKRVEDMANVELRKLRREELLEMLIEQSKEVEALRGQIDEMQKKLDDREIRLNKAGTLAEAAFQLNGVFDAAHAAAEQYLDNIARLSARQETVCAQMEEETKARTEQLLADTMLACETKERTVADRCAAMEQAVQERCSLMKEETIESCNSMKQNTEELCRTLKQETQDACVQLKRQTEEECAAREQEAEARCKALDSKAEQDVEKRWGELSRRLEEFYRAHMGLRELLDNSGGVLRS